MRLGNRKLWWGVGLSFAAVGAFLVFWFAEGSGDGGDLIQDGMVQIGQSRVAVDRALGPDLFQASLGPAPEFDTSPLGVEQPMDRTPVPPPPNVARPAVLVGSNRLIEESHQTGAMFYYAEGVGVIHRIEGLLGGEPIALECLQSANGGTCVGGSLIEGEPGLGSNVADDADIPVVLEWHAIPADTSAIVVLGDGGEHRFWQRPAGRFGLLSVPMEVGDDVRLEAWDSHGEVLATETFTRCDHSDPELPPQC